MYPGLLEEMADSRAGTWIYKTSLEHHVVPESKKVLKTETVGTWHRDKGANRKESQVPKWEQFEQTKN